MNLLTFPISLFIIWCINCCHNTLYLLPNMTFNLIFKVNHVNRGNLWFFRVPVLCMLFIVSHFVSVAGSNVTIFKFMISCPVFVILSAFDALLSIPYHAVVDISSAVIQSHWWIHYLHHFLPLILVTIVRSYTTLWLQPLPFLIVPFSNDFMFLSL